MFKKILIVLMIACFLLGMATRKEKENLEKTVKAESTITESEKEMETNYQISAATVSKVASGDTITNVIFGETDMTVSEARAMGVEGLEQSDPNESVKVKYPKVVIVGNKKDIEKYKETLIESIKFFNNRGKLKKEIPVQKYIPDKQSPGSIEIPKNEKYLGINTPIKEDKGISRVRTVVFNSDGDSLWGFEHSSVDIYLSPNGEYMVGQGWEEGPIVVYNKNGKILNEIENEEFDMSFSADGSYFAVFVRKIDWKMETKIFSDRLSADLVVIDAQGKELWKKEKIAKGDASFGKVKISNNTIIAITGLGELKVYYFNKDGKLLKMEQGDVEQLRNFKD